MAENVQDQPNSTRLVNADVLSTQELRGLKFAKENTETNLSKAPAELPPTREEYHGRAPVSELVMKAFVTCFATTTLFSMIALGVLVWIVPPWYEGLAPRHQAIWCHRVPALCDLRPTLPGEDVLA